MIEGSRACLTGYPGIQDSIVYRAAGRMRSLAMLEMTGEAASPMALMFAGVIVRISVARTRSQVGICGIGRLLLALMSVSLLYPPLSVGENGPTIPDVQPIVRRLTAFYAERAPYRAAVSTEITYGKADSRNVVGERYESSVSVDGKRIATESKSYLRYGDKSEDEWSRTSRGCWDGSKYFESATIPDGDKMHFIGFEDGLGDRERTRPNRGLELDGVVLCDEENFLDALNGGGASTRVERVVGDNGEQWLVLKTSGVDADFEVFVDEESPHRMRKLRVLRDERHEMEYTSSWVTTLTLSEYASVDGVEFASAGTVRRILHQKDGTVSETTSTIARTVTEVNPDFESLGTFKVDSPPGTFFMSVDSAKTHMTWNGSSFDHY